MPTLGAALDFSKYEGRNFRGHQLGTAPASPVTGQLYYNTADNTLYWWDGSAWISARGGTAATPPATTTSLGTIQLAGDLAGTATSPQIAAGVVTDVEVAAANKDGLVAVPSMRTIGTGAQQAMAGNTRLDTIAAPTGPVNLNSQKITNLASPTGASDAANKAYVDAMAQGLDVKASVRAASTGNVNLASPGAAIDGVTLVAGDRVLLKDQTTGSQNGIYIWNGAAAAMTRATDADTSAEVTSGMFTFVEEGTVNDNTGWVLTTNNPITLDTTALVFTQFTGAGSFVAGAGLLRTANVLDVGQGPGITVNADSIQVATGGVTDAMLATPKSGYYSSATHGASATITIPQSTHGLRASRGLIVQVRDEASGNWELPDIVVAANGDVTVTYGAALTANSKRVTIAG